MGTQKSLRIAVIGAGASGMITVVKLREIGQHNIQVFERGEDIGGTWRDQVYPGVACDVPSHLYRFSFAPNPDWSSVCASGSEIHSYLKKVSEDYHIRKNVTFGVDVLDAKWSEQAWHLKTSAGDFGPFDVVITAMGILRLPIFPDIEGRSSFAGISLHSSNWEPDLDVTGKRIGVIGTGSTATQIVPALLAEAKAVTQFQRTPQWIMPLPNEAIPEDERARYRESPEKMQAIYEKLGDDFNNKFAAAVVGANDRFYARMERLCRENLEESIKDPVLREKLRPDYKVGCKRLIMSDRYYDAIQRSNAHLVTEGIDRIEELGVRTNDGVLHEFDILVYATGITAHTPFEPMTVTGTDGKTIDEAWQQGAKAYLGVAIPDFPNFFTIGGPNSPIGNFSFLMTAERQVSYIMKMVEKLAQGEVKSISPSQAATDRFNKAIQEKMSDTIWVTGCVSWYQDKHGNIASWPWSYQEFERMLDTPDFEDFEMYGKALV